MKRRKNEKGRKKVERERTSGRNGWKEESEEEGGGGGRGKGTEKVRELCN